VERLIIYSALYGGYDTIKPLPGEWTGLMFTDMKDREPEGGWTFIYAPHQIVSGHGDPRLVAPMLAHKYWKTHPGKAMERVGENFHTVCDEPGDLDLSIWVDASITLHEGFVEHAVYALGQDDWSMVRHPWRDCVFEEATYSATLGRYASLADDIRRQAAWYRELGHPAHWGLQATGLCIRRHTPAVLNLSHHWWMECLNWSHQDQVSLSVLMRLTGTITNVKWNWDLGWERLWSLAPHLK
jgi:hypothetical protein